LGSDDHGRIAALVVFKDNRANQQGVVGNLKVKHGAHFSEQDPSGQDLSPCHTESHIFYCCGEDLRVISLGLKLGDQMMELCFSKSMFMHAFLKMLPKQSRGIDLAVQALLEFEYDILVLTSTCWFVLL
jgi:hypothetical protein